MKKHSQKLISFLLTIGILMSLSISTFASEPNPSLYSENDLGNISISKQIQSCTQQQLTNTYDNTILYIDYIVDKAIKLLQNIILMVILQHISILICFPKVIPLWYHL